MHGSPENTEESVPDNSLRSLRPRVWYQWVTWAAIVVGLAWALADCVTSIRHIEEVNAPRRAAAQQIEQEAQATGDALIARTTVMAPVVYQHEECDDEGGRCGMVDDPPTCPADHAVVATNYGAYYTPDDGLLYDAALQSDRLALCFTDASAARAAGYIHGPLTQP